MARRSRLTSRFWRACNGRPPVRAAVAAEILAIERAEELPAAGDKTLLLDPEPGDSRGVSSLVYVRRVRGQNLWICYRHAGDEVQLVSLLDALP